MANKAIINTSTLNAIATAIALKDGGAASMLPSAMATRISNIPTGGSSLTEVKWDADTQQLYVEQDYVEI